MRCRVGNLYMRITHRRLAFKSLETGNGCAVYFDFTRICRFGNYINIEILWRFFTGKQLRIQIMSVEIHRFYFVLPSR